MARADRVETLTPIAFAMVGDVSPLAKASTGAWTPTRPMGGWLATHGKIVDDHVVPTVDRDGHVFEAAGAIGRIDFSEYLAKGRWNDTHEEVYVGLPTALEFHDVDSDLAKAHGKVGWWTEGHLFDRNDPQSWTANGNYVPTEKDLQRSDYYWGLATMLKGLPRPLGFSAHGKMILSPCKKRIIWAKVTENAVCEMPKNPDAICAPLRLAVPITDGMIGAFPCETCSCPPSARCPVIPARLAVTGGTPLGSSNPDAMSGSGTAVDRTAELERTADTTPAGARLIRALMSKYGCTEEDATDWLSAFLVQIKAKPSTSQENTDAR